MSLYKPTHTHSSQNGLKTGLTLRSLCNGEQYEVYLKKTSKFAIYSSFKGIGTKGSYALVERFVWL